jgi:hypothetical protein
MSTKALKTAMRRSKGYGETESKAIRVRLNHAELDKLSEMKGAQGASTFMRSLLIEEIDRRLGNEKTAKK